MNRRDFARAALAALPASTLLAKPNSKFSGVQIGAITYCFRSLPSTANDLLKYCTELGISSVELMGDAAENFAGAPPSRPAAFAGGGRRQLTPEQQEAMKKAAEERKKWRLSVSMDKYKALRSMYHDAGVAIEIVKLGLTTSMSDEEYEYVFNVAKALGSHSVTMELPTDAALTKRIGAFAEKHKIYAGYHNHTQVNETSWETALSQSKYNSINLDVGHFTAAINKSPVPFIKANAARISSFHLKDRKYGSDGGDNLPWGQGNTPIREVLQLMKKEKYKWPANIELEYAIGEGTTVMAEMRKCLDFCKQALA
ncbi:MAG: sugar phosphate isomerase/epimerase [Acidobacteria bacterium]|nr:sugar phosphate isomerase/epimerase [Acidobacteriota bacterium]